MVILTNALLSGARTGVRSAHSASRCWSPCRGTTSFSNALPEADRRHVRRTDPRERPRGRRGYVSTSRFYADFMAGYLGVARGQMHVVYPGINLDRARRRRGRCAGSRRTVGYFARICPEKGFHNAVEAFIRLAAKARRAACRLKASGWLGENQRRSIEEQVARARRRPAWRDEFEHVECPDHAEQGAVHAVARRAERADHVPRAEGAVRAGSVGERRAGRAAAARLVPGTRSRTGARAARAARRRGRLADALERRLRDPETRAAMAAPRRGGGPRSGSPPTSWPRRPSACSSGTSNPP